MEPPDESPRDGRTMEEWYQLPAEEDSSQLPPQDLSRDSCSQTGAWSMHPPAEQSMQLEFQDSRLSPALTLLPAKTLNFPGFSNSTFMQQTDLEFLPLRGTPDSSFLSERLSMLPLVGGVTGFGSQAVAHSTALGHASLSQHPLREDEESSCSLSQHSLSPAERQQVTPGRESERDSADEQVYERRGVGEEDGGEERSSPRGREEDDGSFLSSSIPARTLLELLEKDVGVVSSSSAVSSASETVFSQPELVHKQTDVTHNQLGSSPNRAENATAPGNLRDSVLFQMGPSASSLVRSAESAIFRGSSSSGSTEEEPSRNPPGIRECPQGDASVSPQAPALAPSVRVDRNANRLSSQLFDTSNLSHASTSGHPSRPSDVSNITFRSSGCRPDAFTDSLRSQLLSESRATAGSPHADFDQQSPTDLSGGSSRLVLQGAAGISLERAHRDRVLWQSTNQTGVEASFLASQPAFQSTPSVASAASRTRAALLTGASKSYSPSPVFTPDMPVSSRTVGSTATPAGAAEIGTPRGSLTGSEVSNLPSLSYVQKVDAWRANQSTDRAFSDELELQAPTNDGQEADSIANASTAFKSAPRNHLFSQPREDSGAEGSAGVETGPTSGAAGGGVGGGGGPLGVVSPTGRSHSHSSSLATVVTSIQHNVAAHSDDLTSVPQLACGVEPASREEVGPSASVEPSNQNSQRSQMINLGHFSDVSSSRDTGRSLSSPQDSFHGEGSVRASFGGASSVVSLEVDNYAPYWTSIPSTPNRERELNIEDRIPVYLQNLGINQSPSTILNPFAPRGPIREPEFSPTDLCTIKGSTGTPTKSTQPSEGESPDKGEFSVLSQGSSGSLPPGAGRPVMHFLDQDRPPSPGSIRVSRSASHTPPESPSLSATPLPSVTPPHLMPTGPWQESPPGPPLQPSQPREEAQAAQLPQRSPRQEPQQQVEDWLVGSRTLQEIRQLLGRAESVLSLRSSLTTSTGSDSSLLQSLRKKMDEPSLGGDTFGSSQLWARSSSDSMLKDSSVSSSEPTRMLGATAQATTDLSAVPGIREMGLKSHSVRRAEPEGCSATDPDRAAPTVLPVTQAPTLSPQEHEEEEDEEEDEEAAESTPIGQEDPSPAQSHVGMEVTIVSDSSEVSDESLSARVARLLQEESPVSMVTSRASTTDTDESRAREWILLKASGQKCEPLHLNTEDRQRIEEIKRELLLHTKSQYSTDSESSVPSSAGASSAPVPTTAPHMEGFLAVRCAQERLSDQLQRAGQNLLESTGEVTAPVRPDLETRVQEIALREGVPLRPGPPTSSRSLSPLTSITIATSRRTPSPSPLPPQPVPHQQRQAESASVSTQTQARTLRLQSRTPPPSDTESDSSLSYTDPRHERTPTAHTHSQHAHTRSDEPTERETERQRAEASTVETGQVKGQVEEVAEAGGHQSPFALRNSSMHLRLNLSPKPRSVQNGFGRPPPGVDPVDAMMWNHDGTVRSALAGETLSTNWTQGSLLEASLIHEDPNEMTNRQALRGETPSSKRASNVTSPVTELPRPHPEPSVSSQTLSEERGPIRSQLTTPGLVSVHISSSARYPQSFTPPQRLARPSPRSLSVYPPVPAPTLLPYKPHGSSELFYIPKTDSRLSSNRSDTTIESSHTGSDDAVPPRFNVDILGSRDLEPVPTLPKHTEGIYSKKRGSSAYERAAPLGQPGTSVSMSGRKGVEEEEEEEEEEEVGEEEEFKPLPMEIDYSMDSLRLHTSILQGHPSAHSTATDTLTESPLPQRERERTSQEIGGSLDQLWRRFSERWSQDQDQNQSLQASERETSLLERLERLSRLINSSSLTHERSAIARSPTKREADAQASTPTPSQDQSEKVRLEAKRAERGKRKSKSKGRKEKTSGGEERKKDAEEQEGVTKGRAPRLAWAETESQSSNHAPEEEEEEEEEAETDEPERLGPCPAERDSVSTETSVSTIDTQRLLRAFGPHRVRTLPPTGGEKPRDSLLRLYSSIQKQRRATNDSSTVTLDDSSSGSSHPPHPRVTSKRSKVRLVSRGVQAGDLEIVSNGTRRHTRDVGTTFPSPHPTTSSGQPQHNPQPQQHSFLKERPKKKPAQSHPRAPGVSWFVSANELKHDSRKENRPDSRNVPVAPGPTWFEPYSRTRPWREPLRERQNQEERVQEPQREREQQEGSERPQRQQQQQQQSWVDRDKQTDEERGKTSEINSSTDTRAKLSALERLSLQEALAFRRPEFVSRSRERLKRLCLLKEERRLQSQLDLERATLFNHPPLMRRYTHNTAVPAPPLRRAVPKKEMFQRSKQIYSQLPEVRKRKEDEKRKAEYRAYRLNAQLFNKKVTNRVLGRRTPWQ